MSRASSLNPDLLRKLTKTVFLIYKEIRDERLFHNGLNPEQVIDKINHRTETIANVLRFMMVTEKNEKNTLKKDCHIICVDALGDGLKRIYIQSLSGEKILITSVSLTTKENLKIKFNVPSEDLYISRNTMHDIIQKLLRLKNIKTDSEEKLIERKDVCSSVAKYLSACLDDYFTLGLSHLFHGISEAVQELKPEYFDMDFLSFTAQNDGCFELSYRPIRSIGAFTATHSFNTTDMLNHFALSIIKQRTKDFGAKTFSFSYDVKFEHSYLYFGNLMIDCIIDSHKTKAERENETYFIRSHLLNANIAESLLDNICIDFTALEPLYIEDNISEVLNRDVKHHIDELPLFLEYYFSNAHALSINLFKIKTTGPCPL